MLNPNLEQLQQKLLRFTYIYSYRRGRFTLSSGRRSSYYIDGKQMTMTPGGLSITAQYILASLQQRDIEIDAIGGPTLGADSIAAAVTVLGGREGRGGPAPLPSFIVRKETKRHGTASRIEGPFYRGMRTIIVDDVLTTGGSVLDAAAAVEAAGGSVSAIYVLLDRLEGGSEAIGKAGYLLVAANDRSDLERLQQEMEQRYPYLSEALQGETVPWGRLPLQEMPGDRIALTAALEDLDRAVAKTVEDGRMEERALQQTAGRFFSALKAAEYHPDGEAEALRIVQLLQKSLAP